MQDRRRFILKGATLVAAGATAPLVDAPNVIAQPRFQWRMSTTWTPAPGHPPGRGAEDGQDRRGMSGGRLKIQVFAGGELMPPFGCFDACSQGTIEAFTGAPYYWAGKEPASSGSPQCRSASTAGMMAWYLYGDGLKLWEETTRRSASCPGPAPPPACRWWVVPQEDQHHRRLQGPQDAHPRPRRQDRGRRAARSSSPRAARSTRRSSAAPSTPASGSVPTTT